MQPSRYHRVLRTSALVASFLLVFQSGTLIPTTKSLTNASLEQIATVIAGNTSEAKMHTAQAGSTQATTSPVDYLIYGTALFLLLVLALLVNNYYQNYRIESRVNKKARPQTK